MAKLLVDYHFHPNLSKSDARAIRQCHRIWQAFFECKLDAVVITEHVFKNPSRAYQLLCATKPANATTEIFPGLEALTREDIDLIVFAEEPNLIYHLRELLVPKQLDIMSMCRFVAAQPNVFGSVAHPYSIGNSGVIHQLGEQVARDAIQLLGGFEVHNFCFEGSQIQLERLGFDKVLRKKMLGMQRTSTVPEHLYQDLDIKLFTGGSDAHVIREIGSGLLVAAPAVRSRSAIFTAIAHNQSTEFYMIDRRKLHPLAAFNKATTVIREAKIKALRLYEGKMYQNDDQFTSWFSEAEKEAVLEYKRRRSRLLKPILNVLSYFGVSPNAGYIISAFTIALSALLLRWRQPWALGFFLFYMVLATGTDALARYQHKESEEHAITDIALQHIMLCVFVLLAVDAHWIRGLWAATYLILYTVMLWLIISLNKVGEPVRFVLRSRLVIIAAIFLYIFTRWNTITALLIGFSIYMALLNLYMFLRLRKAFVKANTQ